LTTRRALRVTRRAEREIRAAASWWLENRHAAREAFRDDLERAFDLISIYPGIGAQAQNPRLAGVRRIHLARLGYDLYYRVTAAHVEILALWHSSRAGGPSV
jgi:plasmid stabilization system protein ParE